MKPFTGLNFAVLHRRAGCSVGFLLDSNGSAPGTLEAFAQLYWVFHCLTPNA